MVAIQTRGILQIPIRIITKKTLVWIAIQTRSHFANIPSVPLRRDIAAAQPPPPPRIFAPNAAPHGPSRRRLSAPARGGQRARATMVDSPARLQPLLHRQPRSAAEVREAAGRVPLAASPGPGRRKLIALDAPPYSLRQIPWAAGSQFLIWCHGPPTGRYPNGVGIRWIHR